MTPSNLDGIYGGQHLESLEETLAVMSDRSVAAQIRDSQKAINAGERGTSLDDLRADVARRDDRAQ
jgi:hypothetical protein